MPAAAILAGVSKSGSPAARPITLRPAAFSSWASVLIAMVGEGLIRERRLARNDICWVRLHEFHAGAPILPEGREPSPRHPGTRHQTLCPCPTPGNRSCPAHRSWGAPRCAGLDFDRN